MALDIVYLFKSDNENDSNELRYSLRSLRNLPHTRVFIAGEKPDWVTNVIYLPVKQNETKNQNVIRNLRAVIAHPDLSEDFILMNDDFFIMKPINAVPMLQQGSLDSIVDSYQQRYPEGSDYVSSLVRLNADLKTNGVTHPLSYELHIPMPIRKRNAATILRDTQPFPIRFRSLYGNRFSVGGEQSVDVKLFLIPDHNPSDYETDSVKYLNMQTFLSATGGSFKRGLPGRFIRSKFPDKSSYEI